MDPRHGSRPAQVTARACTHRNDGGRGGVAAPHAFGHLAADRPARAGDGHRTDRAPGSRRAAHAGRRGARGAHRTHHGGAGRGALRRGTAQARGCRRASGRRLPVRGRGGQARRGQGAAQRVPPAADRARSDGAAGRPGSARIVAGRRGAHRRPFRRARTGPAALRDRSVDRRHPACLASRKAWAGRQGRAVHRRPAGRGLGHRLRLEHLWRVRRRPVSSRGLRAEGQCALQGLRDGVRDGRLRRVGVDRPRPASGRARRPCACGRT